MENSLSIYGINGPLVTVKGKTDLKMRWYTSAKKSWSAK